MARIRSIKPEFFLHETLADLPALHRLLFIGLWTQADREGRLEDRPKRLKVAILPYDRCDMDAMLRELEAARLIIRYSVGGEAYIAIPNFLKHQRCHVRELPSEIPPPPKHGDDGGPEPRPGDAQSGPGDAEHESGRSGREGKGREQEGKGMDSPVRSLALAVRKSNPPGFDDFWEAYPRKEGKQEAVKVWGKLRPTPEDQRQMGLTLEWQRESADWTKEGGQFVPQPAKWLRGRRWEDERPAPAPTMSAVEARSMEAAERFMQRRQGGDA